jgi:chemotaxis protein MotA
MSTRKKRRFDGATVAGVAGAGGIFVAAQLIEGGTLQSLWQPTAALVVFGGTMTAVVVSYPSTTLRRTAQALRQAFAGTVEPIEPMLDRILDYALKARRRGILSLESELDRPQDAFLHKALGLVVDGTNPVTARQILEIESQALREAAEAPAEVLETAAGYAPTLGILGAVLGLIHVMENLGEPSRLGAGIAVAFVATVYGVAVANLLLLPLATKLRGLARHSALSREIVIEGIVALQDGLNPQLIRQKLRGYLASSDAPHKRRLYA